MFCEIAPLLWLIIVHELPVFPHRVMGVMPVSGQLQKEKKNAKNRRFVKQLYFLTALKMQCLKICGKVTNDALPVENHAFFFILLLVFLNPIELLIAIINLSIVTTLQDEGRVTS